MQRSMLQSLPCVRAMQDSLAAAGKQQHQLFCRYSVEKIVRKPLNNGKYR
jgi:hypothetical protein